jgi:lipopolysaccharide/colanic/teichoic acid biosynthesis glycosyltransferase
MRQRGIALKVKRALDIAGASVLLVAAAPVFAAAAVSVRTVMGSPIFFRQRRPGLGGAPFELIKLRTMTTERDAQGNLLPDAERLGALGTFLRRSSVDELPQLWNVLRGEMSFVGPRPLLMQYLERYSPEQARRHEVLPGITGWGQVHGRNSLNWEQKLALDVWYVDHWSLMLDAKIVWLTVGTVLFARGVNHAASATMPEFLGDAAK